MSTSAPGTPPGPAPVGPAAPGRRRNAASFIDDPVFIARGLGVQFVSAALIVLASLLLPLPAHAERLPIALLALVGLGLGVAMLAGVMDRRPAAHFNVVISLGIVAVSAAIYFVGAPGSGYRFLYLWATPYAFCFLTRRQLAFQVALVATGSALAIALGIHAHPAFGPWPGFVTVWFVSTASVVVVGMFVRHLTRSLRAANSRFGQAFASSPIGMAFVSPDGRLREVNPALCRLLGRSADELTQATAGRFTHPGDLDYSLAVLERLRAEPGAVVEFEKRYLHADGRVIWAHLSLNCTAQGTIFSQVHDVTAQRQLALDLDRGALHDTLTGLATRALLLDRLDTALAEPAGEDSGIAVAVVDLDHFSDINDTLGHQAGDRVLRAVAARLSAHRPAPATLARLDSDEFVAIYRGVGAPQEASLLVDGLLGALDEPVGDGPSGLRVTATAGIAIAAPGADAMTLLRDADTAMHRAKARSRGASHIYDDALGDATRSRLTLEQDLRVAVAENQLVLHYQPVFDARDGRAVALEALVRWNHPTRGMIPPAEFIPVAEECGLIEDVGAWVLREAVGQVLEWRMRAPDAPELRMCVNVAAHQLARPERLLRELDAAMAALGRRVGAIGVELTESALIDDPRATWVLAQLREMGVAVYLDDFGTGYCSLSYLKRFAVDVVKIDQSFIRNVGIDATDDAIVEAVVKMAAALELEVVAEGVETRCQLDRLVALGCPVVQGFGLARPCPATEVLALLPGVDVDARLPPGTAGTAARGRDCTVESSPMAPSAPLSAAVD